MRLPADIGTPLPEPLVTFARTRTSFPRISSGRIRSPAKWLKRSIRAHRLDITITSSKGFSSLALRPCSPTWTELRRPFDSLAALFWLLWSAGKQRPNFYVSGARHTPQVHGEPRLRLARVAHSELPSCFCASSNWRKWSCAVLSTRHWPPNAVTYAVFDAASLSVCLSSNWWWRLTRASSCGCSSASSHSKRATRCRCSTSKSLKSSFVSWWLRYVTFSARVQCRVR